MDLLNHTWIRLTTPPVRDDRGDVPGWVMITLMTAGLVVAILAVAKPGLTSMLRSALDQVR
ncbi:MAG: hypothetical protein L0K86_09185 [Actinomycetia bacterium]|nr:hypothetical protein [Actinomycetes bacterium]